MNTTTPSDNTKSVIHVLPTEVVDRIAAGEVIQRPANIVKELLENALDASATEIKVNINGVNITVTDNGRGIHKDDLALAAQRHATSKLTSTDDFASLATFGFRGEALASISMVARLQLTSRVQDSPVGYTQRYSQGQPEQASPRATARTIGTTVLVQDLFYNLAGRQKSMRAAQEYQHCLTTIQLYAILYAAQGVGLICQKTLKNKSTIDLNTSATVQAARTALKQQETDDATLQRLQSQATKQVITQVFGSQWEPHLVPMNCELVASNESSSCTYRCQGYVSVPTSSIQAKKTQLVLFCNHRLVECPPLKRAMEQIYSAFGVGKPLLFLSIAVPPEQVDVNVHPTKKHVALLHLDEILTHLCKELEGVLQTQEQTFGPASVAAITNNKKRKQSSLNEKESNTTETSTDSTTARDVFSSNKKQSIASSKLIRTSRATQSGALEPFLVSTQKQTQPQSQSQTQSQSSRLQSQSSAATISTPAPVKEPSQTQQTRASDATSASSSHHQPDCPLVTKEVMDLDQPGAFVTAVARCTCADSVIIRLPSAQQRQEQTFAMHRLGLKPVPMTPCNYTSIASLRKRISKQTDKELTHDLKTACFVGVVSRHRSLLQCGPNLVLWNHFESARELFYQLALRQFGQVPLATFDGIDVTDVMEQALQIAETLQQEGGEEAVQQQASSRLPVNETNQRVAAQAATCLMENAAMLEEYFSIVFEKKEGSEDGRILLTGLPVLLDRYTPEPHGLDVFLLRLAMEVDWMEEKACFQGVCRELAAFYAQLPTSQDDLVPHVRHKLFPAITALLIPSERLKQDDGFKVMTNLSKLYRVFERC